MIKTAIIGCGKQSDAHAELITSLSGCEIIGFCDNEKLMAKQMAERYAVKYYSDDVKTLLDQTKPDVVHIITPPHSHLKLGTICLEAGCHLLVEKPFTLKTKEVESLINLANKKKLKITVGHNNQFNPATMRMRKLIKEGFLGGSPIHMESVWGYDLTDQRFAKALLGDQNHWIRRLPGKLLHNIISHGIAKIAEYLKSDSPKVIALGNTSPLLKNINETEIKDELRVIIYDNNNTTAYFTFSSQIKPLIRLFRIFGPKNSLTVNDMHQTLIKECRTDYKSYLNHFVPPRIYAKQYKYNLKVNKKKFLKRSFHLDTGRRILVESFYRSISENTKLPISYRQILLTSTILDNIFSQIKKAS